MGEVESKRRDFLVGKKWLVSESFGRNKNKRKYRKGLGSKKEKVEGTGIVENLGGGCWSAGVVGLVL